MFQVAALVAIHSFVFDDQRYTRIYARMHARTHARSRVVAIGFVAEYGHSSAGQLKSAEVLALTVKKMIASDW